MCQVCCHGVLFLARKVQEAFKRINLSEWIGADTRIRAEYVQEVRDWSSWLAGFNVKLMGGMRGDATGIHAWIFMRRKGAVRSPPA